MTPSKPLLSPNHRLALNPFQIYIVGAKKLPLTHLAKHLPVYIRVRFFDGYVLKTQEVPHGSTCKWKHKHVFLAGKMDPTWLKEQLSTNALKFELHDKDQVNYKSLK